MDVDVEADVDDSGTAGKRGGSEAITIRGRWRTEGLAKEVARVMRL